MENNGSKLPFEPSKITVLSSLRKSRTTWTSLWFFIMACPCFCTVSKPSYLKPWLVVNSENSVSISKHWHLFVTKMNSMIHWSLSTHKCYFWTQSKQYVQCATSPKGCMVGQPSTSLASFQEAFFARHVYVSADRVHTTNGVGLSFLPSLLQ